MLVRQVAAVAAFAVGLAAGCSPSASRHATIEVDAPVALADRPLHVRVTGLHPGEQVTVGTQAADAKSRQWHAEATFTADDDGVVELDRARPTSGTYSEADGMGLFWSMNPPDGDPDRQFFEPRWLQDPLRHELQLTVTAHGRTLGARTLTRQWKAAGVTSRAVTLAADKVAGRLFLPASGSVRRPALLVLGGSEGGMTQLATAALLASHGYPALTIAYFREAGLPPVLENIPLEYFATAAGLLARQPGVDPAHVLAMGPSRGAEAALLAAQNFPRLIHGAILYAPTARVVPAFPHYTLNAWTLKGRAVPEDVIPVDRISGPVLAVGGAQDGIWSSASAAELLMHELDEAHNRYRHEALVYPEAGHNVGTYPFEPQGTHLLHPVTGGQVTLGGTRAANAAAQADSWAKVLSLLGSLHR